MTDFNRVERSSWMVPLGAAVLTATARAVLIGAKDGYAAIGLYGLASRSASRNFFDGLGPCVAVGLVCWFWFGRWRGRPGVRIAVAACLAVIAYLFITGRVPALAMHAPGFRGVRAWVSHAAAGMAAMVASTLLIWGGRCGTAVVRVVTGAAGLLTAAAAIVLLVRVEPSGTRSRPNVILISLDTVRADHLGCYGYPQPTTPEIDRFFSHDAVRFETAFAPQPWTLTSHLTMLTSLHPSVHGVMAHRSLPLGVRTLAQILADEGYLTCGSVSDVSWMHKRFGFGRGFHWYHRSSGSAASRLPFVDALLDDLKSEQFFLFLHFYDAHSDFGGLPYESDPVDRTAFTSWYGGDFTGTDSRGRNGTALLLGMNHDQKTFPEDVRRYLISLYDAGLRNLDRALGDLFRDLEARGLLANSIVVVTADHGEEFQEHGMLLHAQAYDECLHVPLLFRLPGAGDVRVNDGLVGLVDLAPTILDMCGILPPPEMQGRSLRPIIAGEVDPFERSHLLLMDNHGRLALRTPTWKLITTKDGREFYDLASDPGERRDLAADATSQPAGDGLLRLLEEEERRVSALRARIGVPDAPGVSLTESEIKNLRALGYLGEEH